MNLREILRMLFSRFALKDSSNTTLKDSRTLRSKTLEHYAQRLSNTTLKDYTYTASCALPVVYTMSCQCVPQQETRDTAWGCTIPQRDHHILFARIPSVYMPHSHCMIRGSRVNSQIDTFRHHTQQSHMVCMFPLMLCLHNLVCTVQMDTKDTRLSSKNRYFLHSR